MRRESLPKEPIALVGRRKLLTWMGCSPLVGAFGLAGCATTRRPAAASSDDTECLQNVFQLEALAQDRLGDDAYAYLSGGADDMRTVAANEAGYRKLQIRARRLVDATRIDTTVELFGRTLASPILLAPVGFQGFFHPEGELATARAAAARRHRMIASSVSNFSVGEIAEAGGTEVWFQLYPTPNRDITRGLLQRAERAGSRVVVLTVDTPVIGNRERHSTTLMKLITAGDVRMGNYEGLLGGESINDPSMTWEMVAWLKANTSMKVVLKGIVTHEDAALSVKHGAAGVIVSNHGGRQLESDRSTIACLPEVVEAVDGRLPVLIDGGIRRGTDVFKALALGANAVCIGRPFCWGLSAFGQPGVERALELLQAELVRDMQLAGAPAIGSITGDFVL